MSYSASFNALCRVTTDAEVKTTNSGKELINVNLVVVSSGKEDKPFYLKGVIWNNVKVAQYLTKGKPIFIRASLGELQAWSSNGGEAKASLVVNIDSFDFVNLGGKSNSEGSGGNYASQKANSYDDDTEF